MCQFPSLAPAAYGFSSSVAGHDPRRVFALGDSWVLARLAARQDFSQLPHVRHRLLAPKHPPHTLCSLTIFDGPPSLHKKALVNHLFRSSVSRRHTAAKKPSTNPSTCQRARGACLKKPLPDRRLRPPGRNLSSTSCAHGGEDRDRTGNLRLAKAALSQLSYFPAPGRDGGPR
jgi:hypothetical protein